MACIKESGLQEYLEQSEPRFASENSGGSSRGMRGLPRGVRADYGYSSPRQRVARQASSRRRQRRGGFKCCSAPCPDARRDRQHVPVRSRNSLEFQSSRHIIPLSGRYRRHPDTRQREPGGSLQSHTDDSDRTPSSGKAAEADPFELWCWRRGALAVASAQRPVA